MFENNPILGSKTKYDIDPVQSESIKYKYQIKKNLLRVYIYSEFLAIKEEDFDVFLNNLNKEVINLGNENFVKIKQKELDDIINLNYGLEIQYVDKR